MPASDEALLFDVMREAGALGLELSRKKNLEHWTKPDGSHVTEGDLAINALFERRLRAARPGDGWLSEETPDDAPARMAHERLWIIDPIDGTRAFLEGRDEWCVAAALAVGGQPVLAAVHAPRHREFFTATRGAGAALNGERLVIADRASLEGAHIAGNRKALAGLAHVGVAAAAAPPRPCRSRSPRRRRVDRQAQRLGPRGGRIAGHRGRRQGFRHLR